MFYPFREKEMLLCSAALSCVLHLSLLGVAARMRVTQGRATPALLRVTLVQPALPLPVGDVQGAAVTPRPQEKPPEPAPPPPPKGKPKTTEPRIVAPTTPQRKKPLPTKQVRAPAPVPMPPLSSTLTRSPSPEGETENGDSRDSRDEHHHLGAASTGTTNTTAVASTPRPGGGSVSARPEYGINPKPPYPIVARRMGAHGVVLLHVHVRADGSVAEATVAQSSGFLPLDDAALQTVRARWRFIPARLDDIPVESWVEVPIRFVLGDS